MREERYGIRKTKKRRYRRKEDMKIKKRKRLGKGLRELSRRGKGKGRRGKGNTEEKRWEGMIRKEEWWECFGEHLTS